MSLDTEIDLGSSIAGLCAKLDVWIGSAEARMREEARKAKKPLPTPVFGRVSSNTVLAAGGQAILTFPLSGPDQGHFWYVRNVVIGGLNPGIAAGGTADIYVCAMNVLGSGGLTALGLGDWRDRFLTLPLSKFYGSGEMGLRFNEEIGIVVTGATNGQQYVAAVSFQDFEEGVRGQDWAT